MLYLRLFNRFILISLALLGLSVSPAKATVYSEIIGLDINGTSYDVTFHLGSSFYDLWDSNQNGSFGDDGSLFDVGPTFWGDSTGAEAAADSIIDFLADTHATDGIGGGDGFLVPFGEIVGLDYTVDSWRDRNPSNSLDDGITISTNLKANTVRRVFEPFASFAVSNVPVPAAVWLFGTALVGLIGFSRRRKVA